MKPLATHCLNGHPRTPENLKKNRSCKVCEAVRQKRRRDLLVATTGREKIPKGWTPSMIEQTSAEQGGRCMICRQEPKPRTSVNTSGGLCADHDHTTGEPRALLCSNCNAAIGLLRDNPETCRAAAEYLEDWA